MSRACFTQEGEGEKKKAVETLRMGKKPVREEEDAAAIESQEEGEEKRFGICKKKSEVCQWAYSGGLIELSREKLKEGRKKKV